ncbi:MAG: lipoxygenase family protein [Hormoscilla sp.]
MTFHNPPTEQQGIYRYDPSRIKTGGPARIFSQVGEDGILRYIASKMRDNLVDKGQVSEPLIQMLSGLEEIRKSIKQGWVKITTLLADWEFINSGWLNFDLPPGEQFNTSYAVERRKIGQIMVAAMEAGSEAASMAAAEGCSQTEQSDRQRQRFFQEIEDKGKQRPRVSLIYEREGSLTDRAFANQRLAGANPMMLRQLLKSDKTMLQSWSDGLYPLATGARIDLLEAAAGDRLFIVEYPLLKNITTTELQAGRYVGSPKALFYRSESGLEPVSIQLESSGKLFTPSGAADDWMRAKLYVQVADIIHHELIDHLCYTHLIMEAFAIATPRQLPDNHPLYRLLHPHFQFLLAINGRVEPVLLGEDAAIGKLMAQTRETSLDIVNRAYRKRPFEDYSLPNNIKRRGIEPEFLPQFPYRDDAQLLWEAIARYAEAYLQRYYRDDQAVRQDPYLQAWAAELGAPLDSRPLTEFAQAPSWVPSEIAAEVGLSIESLPHYSRVPDFPEKITRLQELIDIATQIIFTCGPQHAALNFSQFDYMGYVPNMPATYARPDVAGSLDEMLPPPDYDLEQMRLTFFLSATRWGRLGSSDLIKFVDAGDRQILAQFQADLQEIESQIQTRNQQRSQEIGLDYPYLLPSQIPNSINI